MAPRLRQGSERKLGRTRLKDKEKEAKRIGIFLPFLGASSTKLIGCQREFPRVKPPVVTIHVQNIDQAAATIERNGGKMVRAEMPVGDMGFAAYFKDSEGNVVGLWQPQWVCT